MSTVYLVMYCNSFGSWEVAEVWATEEAAKSRTAELRKDDPMTDFAYYEYDLYTSDSEAR